MFERTLVPLDGSDTAEQAIPYARELAERLGSKLVLYHVCGVEHQRQVNIHKTYLSSLAETIIQALDQKRSDELENAVSTKVEVGEPRENICSLIQTNNIDLVVMTATGSSGVIVGKMIGSVADHICRNVPVPVMLIRPQQKQSTEKKQYLISQILFTTDGSELAQLALPFAEELASRLFIPITLFQMAHIIASYSDNIVVDDSLTYTMLSNANEERVRTEMRSLEEKLRGKDIMASSMVVPGANAADEIIDASSKVGADLIVMSTHGRSGMRRFLLGAVADKVIRHSEVPVLLVNARAY
jgi:nucleotide-binding universal stress UspA family protein